MTREIWFTDRWGSEVQDDISIDRFAELYDELDSGDDEHAVVAAADSDDWYVEFSTATATLGQADAGGEHLGSVPVVSRGGALEIAKQFIDGDFTALRARAWA